MSNPFWSNVITCLHEFQSKICIDTMETLKATSFLFNDKFKINNSVIQNKVFIKNKLFFVHQLMDDNCFLNFEEFNLKYNVEIDYLSYYSILRCIKTSSNFNELEITNQNFLCQPAFATIIKNKKGAALIYKTLLDKVNESKGRDKWILELNIDQDEWLGYFAHLKRTTPDTKLRWLQLRINHHILTTNRSVSKYKDNQTDLCHFCNQHSETIQHLLWRCNIIKKFWNELISLINQRCKHAHRLEIDEKLAIFGQSQNIYTDRVLDLIILMAKFFIYRSKVQDTPLLLKCFVREVYNRYCAEKIIRKNSNQFKIDWCAYTELFKSLM